MANIVVTSTLNTIVVDFGVYSSVVGYKIANFQKRMISAQLIEDLSFVRVENSQGIHWSVSYATFQEALVIDSIDGIAPTNNEHLFDLLKDLMA